MKAMNYLFGFVWLAATAASAAFIDPGSTTKMTVAGAVAQKDNAQVILEGQIQKKIKTDKYLFVDSTGSVVVEITKKNWRGVDVTPADTVRIRGKINKGWSDTEIKVRTIEMVK